MLRLYDPSHPAPAVLMLRLYDPSYPAPAVLMLRLYDPSYPAPAVLMLRLYDPSHPAPAVLMLRPHDPSHPAPRGGGSLRRYPVESRGWAYTVPIDRLHLKHNPVASSPYPHTADTSLTDPPPCQTPPPTRFKSLKCYCPTGA